MSAPTQSRMFDRFGMPARHDPPATSPAPPAERKRPAPLASKSDPVSSHEAGAAIRASGTETNQMRAIVEWMSANAVEPLTSFEIAKYAGFGRYNVGRRMKTLALQGKVERCEPRVCRESPWSIKRRIPCETWSVVDGVGASRSGARSGAARMPHDQPQQQLANTAATGSAAHQVAPEQPACARCCGSGITRVDQLPDVYQWCDTATGESCAAAEKLRATNPHEVEQSNAAALKTYKLSLPSARGPAR